MAMQGTKQVYFTKINTCNQWDLQILKHETDLASSGQIFKARSEKDFSLIEHYW